MEVTSGAFGMQLEPSSSPVSASISPLGNDVADTWECTRWPDPPESAPITRFDPTGYETTFAAEVKEFDPVARSGPKGCAPY